MFGSFFRATLAASLLASLLACGGGGSAGDGSSGAVLLPAGAKSLAEGAWNGITTDGDDVFLLVLDSGEMFSILSTAGTTTALLHATNTVVAGNAMSAISPRVYKIGSDAPSVPVTLTGTVNASSMSGAANGASVSEAFNLAKSSSYEIPTQMSNVVGTWSGSSGTLKGVSAITNFVISSSGAFTAQDGVCQVNGTIKPRGNVNFFDVTAVNVISTACPAAIPVHGIAGLNSDRKLVMAVVTNDRSNGGIMILTR